MIQEYARFEDVPINQVVQLAHHEQWLELQVQEQATAPAEGQASDSLLVRAKKEAIIADLKSHLNEHAVWDGGFLSNEQSGAEGTICTGVSRIYIWRFGTPDEVEAYLATVMATIITYRDFANRLMRRLASQLGEDVTKFSGRDYYWHPHKQSGILQNDGSGKPCSYFFHGVDCAFYCQEPRAKIEARLGRSADCGDDFGVIERHFFWEFACDYARIMPELAQIIQIVHETKRVWEHHRTRREPLLPEVFPFFLMLLDQRGLLRAITVYDVCIWDWVVVDRELG